MTAVKIQHKNCLQSTLRKKKINTLFAGLGRSVFGKAVPSVLSTLRPRAVLKTSGTVFSQYGPPRRQIAYTSFTQLLCGLDFVNEGLLLCQFDV